MDIRLIQRRSRRDAGFNGQFCRALAALRIPPQGQERAQLWNRLLTSPLCPRKALWLARANDTPMGIIAASIPHPGLGYFGFYEVKSDCGDRLEISTRLLSAAERWLRERGARKVLGPICLSTWFPYRVRTDADPRSFDWEPAGTSATAELLRHSGYSVVATYHTLGVADLRCAMSQWTEPLDRALAEGFRFERVPTADVSNRHLHEVHAITLKAFSGSFLFNPIGFSAFRRLYLPLLSDPSLAASLHFVRLRHGRALGYLLTFRNSDFLVFKSTAVLPEAQGRKLSFALIAFASLQAAALPRSPTAAIFALVRDDNTSRAYTQKVEASCGGLWWHRYSLFGKSLSDGRSA